MRSLTTDLKEAAILAQGHILIGCNLVPGVTHENVHVATGVAVGSLLLVARSRAEWLSVQVKREVAPAAKFSLKGVIELILEFIVGLADMVIGEEGRKFVPMFAAIFLFVWVNNLVGLNSRDDSRHGQYQHHSGARYFSFAGLQLLRL